VFSIIIPTFNRPAELLRCIESVLVQTYNEFEILVINDYGCDIHFEELQQRYKDTRLKFFENLRTKGANGARNTGIDLSNHDYLLFLDDDNYLLKDRLQRLHNVINSEERFNFLLTEYFVEYEKQLKYVPIPEQPTLSSYLRGRLLLNAGSNIVVKFDDQLPVMYWNEDLKRHQDTEYVIRLLSITKCYLINEALFVCTGHNGIPQAKKIESAKKSLLEVLNNMPIIKSHPDFKYFTAKQYRDLCCAYLQEGFKTTALLHLKNSLSIKILPLHLYLRPMWYLVRYFNRG